MTITINGKPTSAERGETYEQIISRALGNENHRILGVIKGGQTLPLLSEALDGDEIKTLTFSDSEGRRIYERSLRFVFLLAVKRCLPEAKVRVENSAGRGVYARITGVKLTGGIVRAVEKEMRDIVQQNLPFEKHRLTREQAMEAFAAQGQTDTVRLLSYRAFDYFPLYRCGGMLEYFYGEMAPSTAYVNVFSLKFNLPGVMLMLPDKNDPEKAAEYYEQPKLMATFNQSARWSEILGCTNVSDLNDMIASHRLREFIRVNEALHEKSVSEIAAQFVESGARLILIAGPSSSGKTTFTHRLSIALRVLGHRPIKLSLDDYYIDREKIPLDENGERDFEKIGTLDIPLFNEHLVRLLQGEAIDAPLFDFKRGQRSELSHRIHADADQPILVEGIHGLNEDLTGEVPRDMKFMIYISALTMLNLDDHNRIRTTDARLLRRLVRDHLFRGTPPEQTLSMWRSVRRGEDNYIFPYQESADVMFNSTLVYEAAILKRYAYPLLREVKEDSPHYTLARRLIKFLNYIHTADVEDEIPINSILREFIGGCCFYREED